MKNNLHKKRTFIDKFARKYYCQHARLNSIRGDKKYNNKKMRRINKKMAQNFENWAISPKSGRFLPCSPDFHLLIMYEFFVKKL